MQKARRSSPHERGGSDSTSDAAGEDTALKSLSRTERARLDIDAWEPSLLRALLEAQNKLPREPR
jgi:hypothetical protein